MAIVKFTSALKRFFPELSELEIPVDTIRHALSEIEKIHPGIQSYIVDDNGALRQHVNIYIDGELIQDRKMLSDKVSAQNEVYIFQALSGG